MDLVIGPSMNVNVPLQCCLPRIIGLLAKATIKANEQLVVEVLHQEFDDWCENVHDHGCEEGASHRSVPSPVEIRIVTPHKNSIQEPIVEIRVKLVC